MRRNPRTAAVVVFVLFSTILSNPNSFASIKPGGKCSKVGKMEILGAKKYTCVKSGNKLLWNSGKKISQPAKSTTTSTDHEIVINAITKDWQKWKANAA